MSNPGLVFCVAIALLGLVLAIAVVASESQTASLPRTRFVAPPDVERTHYAALTDFVNGDTNV